MTALQAYLQNSKTRKVLSKKPGEAGFSLIELVVVVAVLAILAAIAIPAFTSISEKARAAAASNTVATIVKECAVKLNDGGGTYRVPSLDGYRDNAVAAGGTQAAPTAAVANTAGWTVTEKGGTAVLLATTATPTCSGTATYSMISQDTAKYPTFAYNNETGAKTCIASGEALNRGCPVTGGSW